MTEGTGTVQGTANPSGAASDPTTKAILSERRHLINLAYRLLGSLADAEDVAQETYARWLALSRDQQSAIEAPGAWLATVAGRICLDHLGSARVRRERYVGEWVPEPLPGGTEWINGRFGDAGSASDPADRVTLDESIHMAFLVVLESLTPAERVAFILHDVFRYAFHEVAQIVGRSPAACRQLAASARGRINGSKAAVGSTRPPADVVRAFKDAWQAQDITGMIRLLDPNAASVADGGGQVPVAYKTVEGASAVAQALIRVMAITPDLSLVECYVNGQPGILARQYGVTVTVLAFGLSGDQITRIWAVRNPDKLRAWASHSTQGAATSSSTGQVQPPAQYCPRAPVAQGEQASLHRSL